MACSEESKNGITNYEVDNSQPLLIRPHHIRTFRRLVVGVVATTVDEEFAGIAERAKKKAEEIRACSSEDYRKDLIGEDVEGFRSYMQGLITAATEFHHSSDTRVVQLAAKERDMFCNACVIGNHCDKLSIARRAELEQLYVDDFFNFVRAVPEALNRIKVQKRPIDGAKGTERILITDTGTLKRIFRDPFMDYRMS